MSTYQKAITLARMSELLDTIDSSSRALRAFLEQEITENDATDYSNTVSDTLGSSFLADSAIVGQAALLHIACERLVRLVTPPSTCNI